MPERGQGGRGERVLSYIRCIFFFVFFVETPDWPLKAVAILSRKYDGNTASFDYKLDGATINHTSFEE